MPLEIFKSHVTGCIKLCDRWAPSASEKQAEVSFGKVLPAHHRKAVFNFLVFWLPTSIPFPQPLPFPPCPFEGDLVQGVFPGCILHWKEEEKESGTAPGLKCLMPGMEQLEVGTLLLHCGKKSNAEVACPDDMVAAWVMAQAFLRVWPSAPCHSDILSLSLFWLTVIRVYVCCL